MAKIYRKRNYRRRGLAKRARRSGKGAVIASLPRFTGVHRFKEMCGWSGNPMNAAANSSNSGLMAFKLNDLANIISFRGLFDLYKITGVKVKIIPRFTNVDPLAASTGAAGLPMLYIAEQRNPYVPAPTAVSDILNDDGCKVIRLTRPVNLYIKNPKPEIFDTSGNSLPFQFNSSNKALQPWLTTGGNAQAVDQSTVNHFGYRWLLDNTLCTGQCSLEVYTTYYFSMKEQD